MELDDYEKQIVKEFLEENYDQFVGFCNDRDLSADDVIEKLSDN